MRKPTSLQSGEEGQDGRDRKVVTGCNEPGQSTGATVPWKDG